MPSFVHLHAHSAFSFGSGTSGIEEMVLAAMDAGMPALALTDTMSLSGIPTLVKRCCKAGIQPIGGTEIILEGGNRLTLLADGPTGFSSLCRILSYAHLRDPERKGARVRWQDMEENAEGLVCLTGCSDYGLIPRLIRKERFREALRTTEQLVGIFGAGNVAIEIVRALADGERRLSRYLFQLADRLNLPPVATNVVRHSSLSGYAAHEALRRIALKLGPDEEHGDLPFNAEHYLKREEDLRLLFADRLDAIENAARLAQRLAPPLDPTVRHLPRYPNLPPGESAFSYLAALTSLGAKERYKSGQKGEVDERLVHELETIRDLGYCDYILICRDVCFEAKRRGIAYALRGSAIGSAVLYCLGLSEHDPIARRVSFDRFLSKARRKPPDIDIDFRHDERDSIMEYTRKTFGEERVGCVANYVTWRGRSLLRDMGKVLGLNGGEIDQLRELLWHSRGDDIAEKLSNSPELRELGIEPENYSDLFALCATMAGLPRHLGTHSSGIVVSDDLLSSVVPVQWAAKGVPICAYDKDDVESLGIGLLKMDQLCLRTLTALDIAVGTIRVNIPNFDYAGRDREDLETLALIRTAQTVGVFQLESPAQMALQWRLQADRFDDLIASVALIRPGPLVGGGVSPYIACRNGWRKPSYPLPELEAVLAETYGRILYQDQVLDVVRTVGGFDADEADVWLKTMTHARSQDEMERLGEDLWLRAKAKGMKKRAFEKLWPQVKGFSRYGFCHGHSLAFADHAQGTAYLLRHYPAEFLAGVLSTEPCGFWPTATVTAEAERRGVTILGPCLNESDALRWKVTESESGKAIRASLYSVRAIGEDAAKAILAERGREGPFASLVDVGRRLWFLPRDALEWLTLAGALDCLCPSRRQTLWTLPVVHAAPRDKERQAKRVRATETAGQASFTLPIPPMLPANITDFSDEERFVREWEALSFSPSGHPMTFYRADLAAADILPCARLQECQAGDTVMIAGLSLRPHRPPIPSGEIIVFLTLEDETGMAQVTCLPEVYEQYGAALLGSELLAIEGKVELRGNGRILMGQRVVPLSPGGASGRI